METRLPTIVDYGSMANEPMVITDGGGSPWRMNEQYGLKEGSVGDFADGRRKQCWLWDEKEDKRRAVWYK